MNGLPLYVEFSYDQQRWIPCGNDSFVELIKSLPLDAGMDVLDRLGRFEEVELLINERTKAWMRVNVAHQTPEERLQ